MEAKLVFKKRSTYNKADTKVSVRKEGARVVVKHNVRARCEAVLKKLDKPMTVVQLRAKMSKRYGVRDVLYGVMKLMKAGLVVGVGPSNRTQSHQIVRRVRGWKGKWKRA